MAKILIGQTTGRKLDAEVVACGADTFPTFLNAATHQQDMEDLDIKALEEETNFTSIRDVVDTASQVQHPITYGQFDLCSIAKGDTLKMLKLPMLQRVCEDLALDVPQPPVRRRASYVELL